jgi:hypothetical protein
MPLRSMLGNDIHPVAGLAANLKTVFPLCVGRQPLSIGWNVEGRKHDFVCTS